MKKIGFIGCGNMSRAIIDRILKSKDFLQSWGISDILVSDINAEQLAVFDNSPLVTTCDNDFLISQSDCVVLAVKPQSLDELIGKFNSNDKLIISIIAGATLQKLREVAASNKIVRVMPNLNARVGLSYSAFSSCGLDIHDEGFVAAFLTCFGMVDKKPESAMNVVTGIAGSGPAFVFMFMKAFIRAAEKYGFNTADAREISYQTIAGSIENLLVFLNSDSCNEAQIDKLIESVCSKGGTTIRGVEYLREQAFEEVVIEAIDRAVKRAGEL